VQQVEAVLGVDPASLPARRRDMLRSLSEPSSSNP
jgi:hypothetical protein